MFLPKSDGQPALELVQQLRAGGRPQHAIYRERVELFRKALALAQGRLNSST